jgi:hypothetical protein
VGQGGPNEPKREPPDLSKVKPLVDEDFSDPEHCVLLQPGWKPPRVFHDEAWAAEMLCREGRWINHLLPSTSPKHSNRYLGPCQHKQACADFACQATCRMESKEDALWMIYFCSLDGARGRSVAIRMDGRVEVGPLFDKVQGAWQGQGRPIRHRAVRPGQEWNTLLLVKRGRALEVFVNGSAVADPVALEEDLGLCAQGIVLYLRGTGEARAEYSRFTVWELPPGPGRP